MLKVVLVAVSFALAGPALAQTQPGQTTPSVTPSPTPGVIPPSQPPVIVGGPAPAIGGVSKCENLIGTEKEKCLREDAATGSTGGRAAGAGGSHAPGSTGTGAGTSGPQRVAPAGSVR